MQWFFLLFSTVCWGIAEIFYKKGNSAGEKYAHLKTTVFVGIFFGIYSLVILCTRGVEIRYLPANFLRYLPVALCYIVSMTCSYFGVRFIEESISDPIENTSCAFVPILCAIFMHESLTPGITAVIVVVITGILGVGLFDIEGKNKRKSSLGIKLAVISIAMPFCYMILDAVGTFLDIFYTDSVETTVLLGVTEENLEHTANCCYEFAFLIVALGILIYLKCHHVGLFDTAEDEDAKRENRPVPKKNPLQKIGGQKYKIIAAIFETGGQATYLFALSEGAGVAAVIIGAGTVIISFVLSRVVLKERLSKLQYTFIGVIFAGIITLSLIGV